MKKFLINLAFYSMFYMRKPFMAVAKILGFLLLASGLLMMFFFHGSVIAGIISILLSFGIFILNFNYNKILLKINPTGVDLILSL